jgi:hypothetical protein
VDADYRPFQRGCAAYRGQDARHKRQTDHRNFTLFRTHNPQPSFTITATSNFPINAAALVPQHAFYQVDGWRGTWTPVTLKAKNGAVVSTGTVKVPALLNGQHVLYVFASDGDVGTVQDGNPNSSVISPIGSVVFTVEK